jgi:hypothetical protein
VLGGWRGVEGAGLGFVSIRSGAGCSELFVPSSLAAPPGGNSIRTTAVTIAITARTMTITGQLFHDARGAGAG